MNLLVRLCCSQKTLVEISPAKFQLFEMVLPASPFRHVLQHLADICELADLLQKLPGGDTIKIVPIARERSSWAFRAAVAAGVFIAAVSVMAAMRDRTQPVLAAGTNADNGIVVSDAAAIPLANEWRVAEPGDFNAGFSNFFTDAGQKLNGRITFDPDGSGRTKAVAYFLIKKNAGRRLVILVDQHSVFDSTFPTIAGIVPVPSPYFSNNRWDNTKTVRQQISGDAILLVRDADDVRSGIVLYFRDGALQTTALPDYRKTRLQ